MPRLGLSHKHYGLSWTESQALWSEMDWMNKGESITKGLGHKDYGLNHKDYGPGERLMV